MAKERIHLYLSEEMVRAIQALTQRPGELSTQAEELLQLGLSLKKGDIIEQRSLPVIRDIIQGELRKAVSQLRSEMREDEQNEIQTLKQDLLRNMKDSERRAGDRIVGLLIRVLREALISRRMLYALIARQDPDFAAAAFEDARAKAGRDIAAKASEGAA